MISPENIKSGDKFKVIAKFGLWDLTAYQTRLETQLKANEGWKKKADGNLMTLEELKQAPFEKPTIKDGLSLPPLSSSEERIAELQPGAEITTIQVMYHTGKAASENASNKDKAFQSLLVSTLVNDETKYGFVWTTHADVDHVEQIVPIEEEDPPIEEEEKEEQSSGEEIHVKAGQTTVLEVKTEGTGTGEEEDEETGSIEVELVDEDGNPYLKTDVVHLVGQKAIYSVSIDKKTGKGIREDIPIGDYELALQLSTIYFDHDKLTLSKQEQKKLIEVANQISISELDFERIKCLGYSNVEGSKKYNEDLSLKRAIQVKNFIVKTQDKFGKEKIGIELGKVFDLSGGNEKSSNKAVLFGILE